MLLQPQLSIATRGAGFLSIKRSVMNLPNRGNGNKFTRDVVRICFHPLAFDPEDCEISFRATQSSLIDGVVCAHINGLRLEALRCSSHRKISEALFSAAPDINEIASGYAADDSDCEHQFYKHSSAWLESRDIVPYRRLADNFYDAPESSYIRMTDDLLERVKEWTGKLPLDELSSLDVLTRHPMNT